MSLANSGDELREIVIMTGSTALLGILALFIPPLSFLANVLAPIPIIYLVHNYNLRKGIISLFWACILVYFSTRTLTGAVILIQLGTLGLLMGLIFKNHISFGKGIFLSCLTAVVLYASVIGFSALVTGVNPFTANNELQKALEDVINFQRQSGLLAGISSEETNVMIREMTDIAKLLLPGTMVIWSASAAFFTFLMARVYLRKKGLNLQEIPAFREWCLPWVFVWSIIIGLCFVLIGDQFQIVFLSVLGKNILFIFSFVFAISGVAILIFFYNKFNISSVAKLFLLLVAAFYWPVIAVISVVLGIIDPFINIREKYSKKGAIK